MHIAAYLMWRINWIHPFFEVMDVLLELQLTLPCVRGSDLSFLEKRRFPISSLPIENLTTKHCGGRMRLGRKDA